MTTLSLAAVWKSRPLPASMTASLILLKMIPEPELLVTVISQVAVYEPESPGSLIEQEVKQRAMQATTAIATSLIVFMFF
jgi:hypothetical protein